MGTQSIGQLTQSPLLIDSSNFYIGNHSNMSHSKDRSPTILKWFTCHRAKASAPSAANPPPSTHIHPFERGGQREIAHPFLWSFCRMWKEVGMGALRLPSLSLSFFFFFFKIFDVDHLKVFIEFVTMLLLFYVLVLWSRGAGGWDLSSLTRYWTHTLCIGRQSLNH